MRLVSGKMANIIFAQWEITGRIEKQTEMKTWAIIRSDEDDSVTHATYSHTDFFFNTDLRVPNVILKSVGCISLKLN